MTAGRQTAEAARVHRVQFVERLGNGSRWAIVAFIADLPFIDQLQPQPRQQQMTGGGEDQVTLHRHVAAAFELVEPQLETCPPT